MIKAIAGIKSLIGEINETEKNLGMNCNYQQFERTFASVQKLIQAQNAMNQLKKTTTTAPVTSTKSDKAKEQELIDQFMDWMKKNGFDESKCSVKVGRNLNEGTGLVATKEIKEGEVFVEVPKELFITEQTAIKSLGEGILKERFFQMVPNMLVVLQLIKESLNEKSFWAPYINLLPKTYNTAIYFTLDDFKQLEGSNIQLEAMRSYRSSLRQYCYLYEFFANNPGFIQTNVFTWELFAWGVGAVMSRQNAVPVGTHYNQTALIPFWDFANHTPNGKITTYFEGPGITASALKNYKPGEQVFIYYGDRDNTHLLLYSGFSVKTNLNDNCLFSMQLENDDLKHDKIHILEERGLNDNMSIKFSPNPAVHQIPQEAIPFYRVASLNEKQTQSIAPKHDGGHNHHHHHHSANCGHDISLKKEAFDVLDEQSEKAAFTSLLNDMKLKLKSYPTTLAQDEDQLKQNPPAFTRFILYAKISEKKILERNIKYVESLIEKGVLNANLPIPDFSQQSSSHGHSHGGNDHGHSHGGNDHGHSHGGNDHGHSHGGGDHGHSHSGPSHGHSHGGNHGHQHGANCKH
ncbi:hypothetical protein CYY_000014 [Polysphondylium violaceum]|uniref:protein-histidine N-methyltransferase n=1 Tax=Polysphondylium violaceum TaxID=133409 RepID=A0A8J4V607_9MYCE|nr:hypothetical protein CYY_000014 [Polysphondylium violaceum]